MSIQSNANKGIALAVGAKAAKMNEAKSLISGVTGGQKRLSDIATQVIQISSDPNYSEDVKNQALDVLKQEQTSLKKIVSSYKERYAKITGKEL